MKKFFNYLVLGLLSLNGILVLYGSIAYSLTYVYRVLVWQDSDAFDQQKFPNHPLSASPTPYHFASSPDPRGEKLFTQLSDAQDWDSVMESNGTQAFIVIQDGTVLHENYYNDAQRDSIVTSFSVAKSFDSALIGKAIEEGFSNSLDDPIKTSLDDGDILLFYTDGVIEAQNINEEFFGEDRLMELSGSHNKSAEEIQVHIIGNLQSFVGEADPFADITLLTVKRE